MTKFNKLQSKTSKIKIVIPLLFIYTVLLIVSLIPLPSYILIGIVTIVTIIFYFFINEILKSEERLIKNYYKQLNDFHEIFTNLSNENNKLSDALEREFKDFDEYVISSKTDLFGRITYASEAFQKISGYSEEELIGKPHNIVRHPDEPKEIFKEMWNTIEDNHIWSGEVKNKKKNNGYYKVKAIVSPILDEYGIKIGYNSVRQLIEEG